MAVGHQRRQRKAMPGGVPGAMEEVIVGADEPSHMPAFGMAAHDGIDLNCPLGHSGQQQLWHGVG